MQFECDKCLRLFSTKCNLNRHLKNVHHEEKTIENFLCALCEVKLRDTKQYFKHLENEHSQLIKIEKAEFNSSDGK